MSTANEIWKDINGYEGLYQISNFGIVKSVDRISKHSNGDLTLKGKILKKNKNSKGYLYLSLCKNGKYRQYLIHRLVAEHFIPNPDNKPYIDHINTDRSDNRVENLRWVTHKENINNPLTIDKKSKKLNKPIIQFSRNGEFIRKWDSALDAQRELGIKQSNICSCCKGKLKTTGGYMWRYYYKGIWLKTHIPLKAKMVS